MDLSRLYHEIVSAVTLDVIALRAAGARPLRIDMHPVVWRWLCLRTTGREPAWARSNLWGYTLCGLPVEEADRTLLTVVARDG